MIGYCFFSLRTFKEQKTRMPIITRLNGGSTKNDQKYTTNRVNNADFRNDLHFFVTSSRPIKAEPKGPKSATFGMQNLPEGGEIENNVMKYVTPIFHS